MLLFQNDEPPEITYCVVDQTGTLSLQALTPTQPMPSEEELNDKFAELVVSTTSFSMVILWCHNRIATEYKDEWTLKMLRQLSWAELMASQLLLCLTKVHRFYTWLPLIPNSTLMRPAWNVHDNFNAVLQVVSGSSKEGFALRVFQTEVHLCVFAPVQSTFLDLGHTDLC